MLATTEEKVNIDDDDVDDFQKIARKLLYYRR